MSCPPILPLWLSALLVLAPVAASQPSLPEGLGGASEPVLPEGIGDDERREPEFPDEDDYSRADIWADPWPEKDAWDVTDGTVATLPVSGFWETRLGHRLSPAENQRDASLAETRLELEADYQWQGGAAKLTADLIYDAVEESRHLDLETGAGWLDVREASALQRLGERAEVKVGRQILTWGVGDLVFINDLFPKDWNSFLIGRDEQYLKAPSDAVRVGWYGDAININLVYVPRFDADRYIDGRRLSYYSPLAGLVVGQNGLVVADRPDHSGSDDEWALRAYRRLGSYEVALYGYDGFWKSPAGVDPSTGAALFPRLRVYGASARGPLGPGILSLEGGYYDSRQSRDGRNPLVNNDELRLLAGYEWELMTDTTLGLQYYLETLWDYHRYRGWLVPGQPVRDEYRQLLTARVTRQAMNQNLTLSLFVFYSPTDEDVYLRPKVNYKVDDHWQVEGGINLFRGEQEHTFFGQFEDNSNIYAALRYSF